MNRSIASIAMALTLAACSDEDIGAGNCGEKIDRAIGQYGAPEDVNTYSGGGNVSQSLWWWSQGREITFSSGYSYDNCETSTYTFTPL